MQNKRNIRMLAHLSILITTEIILSRFFSLTTPVVKIGFAFVPLALCGIMYGPFWTGVVAVVADLIGAGLFPSGVFFPGFTLSAGLSGIAYGVFLHGKNYSWKNLIILVLIQRIVIGLVLTTYWLTFLTSMPFETLLAARVLQVFILVPVQLVVLRIITQKIHAFSFCYE